MFIGGRSQTENSTEFNIESEYKRVSEKYYELLKKQKDNAEFIKVIIYFMILLQLFDVNY